MIATIWILSVVLFCVRGDVVEVFPSSYGDTAVRIEFFGDEVDRITEIDTLTGEVKNRLEHVAIFPNSHYVIHLKRWKVRLRQLRRNWQNR